MKYRKKPILVEAFQFTEEMVKAHLWDGILMPAGLTLGSAYHHPGERRLSSYRVVITTLEGDMEVKHGDWVITGVKGEQYLCKPDIFEATYEPESTPAQDQREVERWKTLYRELLYAVAQKYEGETRHQTALRYIQQQENRSASGQDAPKQAEGEGWAFQRRHDSMTTATEIPMCHLTRPEEEA